MAELDHGLDDGGVVAVDAQSADEERSTLMASTGKRFR